MVSPLKWWVWFPAVVRCTQDNIMIETFQQLATGQWLFHGRLVFSINTTFYQNSAITWWDPCEIKFWWVANKMSLVPLVDYLLIYVNNMASSKDKWRIYDSSRHSLCLHAFHLVARKANLEKKNLFIQTNSFKSFTCPIPVWLIPGFGQVVITKTVDELQVSLEQNKTNKQMFYCQSSCPQWAV